MNGLALCAGVGGLELGLRLALGDGYRTVGYVEREAFAAAVLVARMEDQTLEPAPVWDDLATFDGRPWRGRVDLVSAGFPCQPASHAGQRLGTDDERWLWPHVARVVREVGPRLVFIENVPGLLSVNDGRAMREVLGDLAALGFDAEWTCLSAADVGATQRRERLWLLAHRDLGGLPRLRWQSADDGHARHDAHRPGGAYVANPDVVGEREPHYPPRPQPRHNQRQDPCGGGFDVARTNGRRGLVRAGAAHDTGQGLKPAHPGEPLAHPQGEGHERPGLRRLSAVDRWCWPPGPDDTDAWAEVARTDGPQPSVRRVADGLAHRLDRLHATGNGVVPLVAATAFIHLARRAGLVDVTA